MGRLSMIGLAVQAIGPCVFFWRQASDVPPDFVDAKREFAKDMDAHFLRTEGAC